jgi:uncharacterized membrane protein
VSARSDRVKLIAIFQGKWLGHPVHPAVVHMPLALWIGAALLDALYLLGVQNDALVHLALYAVLLGLAGALIAVPTGLADWMPIKRGKPARRLGIYHMALNGVAAVMFTANFILRADALDEPEPVNPVIATLSIVGALILLVSGYLGSLLAFDHGVSVARLSKKKWREMAAQSGANLPPEK